MEPGEDDAPYWRTHHGIGRRWTPSPAGRRGCLMLVFGGLALILIVLVVAVLTGDPN